MFWLKIAAVFGWLKNVLELAEGYFLRVAVSYLGARGYQRFTFNSFYYGSHPEYGEGEVNRVYFFNPKVDLSLWVDKEFSHGHFSEDEANTDFSEWLARQKGLFIELPRGH